MKWEVRIVEDPTKNAALLRIFQETAAGEYLMLTPTVRDGQTVWSTVKVLEGEMAPSALEFSGMMLRLGILDALATGLAEYGARVRADVNEATVEAMKVHLSDLQSLIFGSDDLRLVRGRKTDADL